MSTVSYDGQSFSVDGRRIWLVSGAIHYARTPHQLWRKRLRAAKEAGLNCIETYCFWNAHEPRPGQFNFKGDLDLRRFVELCGEEGLWCIVRPGPYICAEWDFGGLPTWLHRIEGMKLRQAHPSFLEACSRYLTAIMNEVRDLQVAAQPTTLGERPNHGNHPGQAACGYYGQGGGPILMMQAENEWFCHNPEQGDKYLNEIARYLRENGCTVPINNCNNLWQGTAGTINTWNGARNLAVDMRQLATVQPDAPRFVTEYWPGWFDEWGKEHSRVDPQLHLYRMAGILATGAQFNLYMFHGGTNFAFWGGRTVGNPGCFMTTSYDYDAPLLEAGGRGEKYVLTKRICTFASQFSGLFANLRRDSQPTTITPSETDHALSIIHSEGEQGDVVFLLKSEKDRNTSTRVMLPNGSSMPVELGEDRAAWFVLDVNLAGIANLDYTNLRPWAFVSRRVLVLFGPAGTDGIVSLDGAQFHIAVPTKGATEPVVEKHDDITVVVLSDEQVDSAYLFGGGIALNAAELDDAGKPVPAGRAPVVVVSGDGKVSTLKPAAPKPPKEPKLGAWDYASLASVVDGSDAGFREIPGPDSLERLDADYGYGWYKLNLSAAKGGRAFAPESGDRLHVYSGGKLQSILGLAPGAVDEPADLRATGEVVVLADNLGRYNYGQRTGEQKGLFGHLLSVKPVKLPKPKIVEERAADPFAYTGYVYHFRRGQLPMSQSYTYEIKPDGKLPVVLELTGSDLRATVLLNNKPIGVYLGGTSGHQQRWVLRPGEDGFTPGKNQLKLSILPPGPNDIAKSIKLYQTTAVLSDRGAWSFRAWTTPKAGDFTKIPRTLPAQPAWFRTTFTVSDNTVPLWFEPRGMTKGQLYLNGHNLGRYFVATREKKAVPPQLKYYLPEPWLNVGSPNELLVFDEHGASPAKSRLVYDPMGPYN